MKSCASCRVDKPEIEFGSDRSRPSGLSPYCKPCAREKQRVANAKFRAENPGYNARLIAERRRDPQYKAKERARARLSYEENAEKRREYSREYNRKFPEVGRAYRAAKPEVARAIKAKRRAAYLNAMPPWADKGAIQSIYAEAQRKTRETGVQHHVDHVVPLRGKLVSGLHVHWNLQVLTATANRSKYNRLDAAA